VARIARTVGDGLGAREWLEMGGEKKVLGMSASLAARTAADGKWVRRIGRTAADGVGAREWLEMGGEKKLLGMSELGCGRHGCKGVGGNGWEKKPLGISELEMGGEKKPLRMSELGCVDGCGRRRCKGVAGNGRGEEAAGNERAWLRGRLRTVCVQGDGVGGKGKKPLGMSEFVCKNGCGRRGCKGVGGNGWGGEAAGNERVWLRGWLRTPWVQGNGWKWVGRRSRWG